MLERKIAEGICFDCPKKAVVGKRRCNEHLVRASEYQVKYKTAPPKARIIPLGHCQCGNAPMTGRDVCWCCDQKRAAR
jgi:hypothetical protein